MSNQSLKFSRIINNSLVFIASLFITFYSHIPFAFWVSATVLAITLPLDSQQIAERIKNIFIGTIQGLIIYIPIWLILDFNSGLLFLILPLALAAMNFYQIHNFTRNIAFLNINLGLFLEFIQFGNYHYSFYLVARIMAVAAGIVLAWVGEYLLTRNKNFALYEFQDTLQELSRLVNLILDNLNEVHESPASSLDSIQLIQWLTKANALIGNLTSQFKSIKIENSRWLTSQHKQDFQAMLEFVKRFKIELMGIGYIASGRNLNPKALNFSELNRNLMEDGQNIQQQITALREKNIK